MFMRAIIFAMFCLAALPAAADAWRLQDGSTFTFEASFENTPLEGRFTSFDVRLDFEPQQQGSSSLQVTVDLAGADMGDPDMNEAIAQPEWFDVKGFPRAQYESFSIVETAPGKFVAHGVLVMKGIRRDVDVPFSWSESNGMATMQGELTVKRNDFDVGLGQWATGEQIGRNVVLRFALQLARAN
jgi:polyisoprenoid-binding protein YceI